MSENERLVVFSFILMSLTRLSNLNHILTTNSANLVFVRTALFKKENCMGFIVPQGITTLILGLLKLISLYTNSSSENLFWTIVTNFLYLSIISWLYTLGYYIKSFDDAVLENKISYRDTRITELNEDFSKMRNILKAEVFKLEKEKERFFSLVEKMVDGAGVKIEVKKGAFALDDNERAILKKERAAVSNFV